MDKDSALIASAVRSGSFRISSPRQTLNQETDCVFQADNQRGALASGAGGWLRSSPLNPCQSPFSCCSQRITGSAPHGTELRAQPFSLEKARLEVSTMATGANSSIRRFDEVVDVGRSLGQDRKRQAEHESKPGHGDRGDRKR